MELWTILLTILLGALLIYYYFFRGLDRFAKLNVPHVKPLPLFGNMASSLFRQMPVADLVNVVYNVNRDAKYVGFFDLMNPVFMIRDLELIKSISVKHFEHFPNHRGFVDENTDPIFGKNLFSLRDEKWRDARNILSPAFTSSKMKTMFKLMSNCAKDFVNFLSEVPESKKVMDLKDAFTRYTNDVIGTCAFGISVDSMRCPKNEFYVLGREATNFDGIRSLKFFIIRSLPKLSSILGIKLINDELTNFFKNLVASTIKARDDQNIYRPDMIQLMMETRGKRGEGRELSILDMTSQAFIFFLGGFDTTSTLMCFAAHEIGICPDVQAKLQAEIDEVLRENDGVLTYEALNKMEYLDCVINEALRIHPVLPFLDRVCSKNFELPPAVPGGKPVILQEGDTVWFPIYGLLRDPLYYEDPETFNPDRFRDKEKKLANHPSFLPFGIGPRMCIGNRFALLETKVLLFHLLAKCDLVPCSKTMNPIKLTTRSLTMMPEKGFWLKIQPRKTSSDHQELLKKCFTLQKDMEMTKVEPEECES